MLITFLVKLAGCCCLISLIEIAFNYNNRIEPDLNEGIQSLFKGWKWWLQLEHLFFKTNYLMGQRPETLFIMCGCFLHPIPINQNKKAAIKTAHGKGKYFLASS